MLSNLHSIYSASETRAKWSLVMLLSLLSVALVGTVFWSPSLVVGVLAAAALAVLSFFKPTWSLALLMVYLPFEPFLLKWVPVDLYLYARYGSEFIIYFLAAVVIWKIVSGEVSFKRTPIDVPFVFLLFIMGASILINLLPATTAILGARQILRFILLFFITVQLRPTKVWMKTVALVMGIVLSVQICIGAAQVIIGEPLDLLLLPSEQRTFGDIQLVAGNGIFWDPGQRIFGTLGRYDQLGTFMAFMMLIIVAILYERAATQSQRLWIWALLAACLPILALTYSRASWFGFVLGFLFIGAFIKRDKNVLAALVLIPSLLIGYVAVTGLVVRHIVDVPDQSIVNRFYETFSYEHWAGDYYGFGRLYWIINTFTVVIPAAPIFGHGPGMYGGGTAAALSNSAVYDSLSLPFGVFGTEGFIDNNWLSLWGELGTLGFGVYVWLMVTLFLACWHVYKNSEDPETRALALGVCATFLAVSLNAFLGTYLEVRTLAPYLWIFAGTVVALGQREKIL